MGHNVMYPLQELEQWWKLILKLEQEALTDPWCKQFWDCLLWPRMPWVREIMVSLSECKFHTVPEDVKGQLLDFVRGFSTSLPNELIFNHLRDCERASKNQQLSRATRWHRAITSKVAEECDRPQVAVTAVARNLAHGMPKLNQSFFAADMCEFSLGDEAIKHLMGPADWPTPSAANFVNQVLSMRALVQTDGDVAKLQSSWLSVLLVPGTLVAKKTDPNTAGMVLHSSAHGALIWKMTQVNYKGFRYCRMSRKAAAGSRPPMPWHQVLVHDTSEWVACDMVILTPGAAQKEAKKLNLDLKPGIYLLKGQTKPLLEMGALNAFPGVTIPWMRKMCTHLGLTFARGETPKTERQFATALVQHVLPQASEAEVKSILEKRFAPDDSQPMVKSVLMEGNNLDMAKDLFERDEADDAAAYKAKYDKKKSNREAKPAAAAGAAASSSSSSSAAPASQPVQSLGGKVSLRGSKTPEEAKQFLPQVPGARLHRDSVRHYRWQAFYPCPPPCSCSKGWGQHLSERQALVFVLKWVWATHTALTGQQCPWEFAHEADGDDD